MREFPEKGNANGIKLRARYSPAARASCFNQLILCCSQSVVVVRVLEGPVYCRLRRLHRFPADHHLVQDLVHLVEVEDQVELAHAPEVLVQHLHEQVYELKHRKFVVFLVHAEREEEPRVASVYQLVIAVLPGQVDCLLRGRRSFFGLAALLRGAPLSLSWVAQRRRRPRTSGRAASCPVYFATR